MEKGEWADPASGPTGRPDTRWLTIGQVSQRTGIPAKTIRYYESIGLLPPAPRGDNAYRRYGGADINRLLLLRRIKLLGAPLADAKTLLESAADARCVDAQEAMLALVDERLRALDQQISELLELRDEMRDYRRELGSCRTGDDVAFRDCTDIRCIGALPPMDGVAPAARERCDGNIPRPYGEPESHDLTEACCCG